MSSDMSALTKIYPDTEAGALSYLKEVSDINLKNATAYADPYHVGVWIVNHPNDKRFRKSIVYLINKNRTNRDINDFESGD